MTDHDARTGDRGAAPETDPRFKTGRWKGFWIQGAARSRTELDLRFDGGEVSGDGHDWVGDYVLSGVYDLETGKVSWVKAYLDSHTVEYDGCAETSNGIWGMWSIGTYDKGGFQIWPEDQEGEERNALAAAQEREIVHIAWSPSQVAEHELASLTIGG